jgi:capsular exopolysaccharide synthesis family protein
MNELTFDRIPRDEPGDQAANGAPERQPLLLRYLNILRRRMWLLIGSVVVAAVLGLILTLLMTPQYTAETTIEIKRESYQIVDVEGVEPDEGGRLDQEFYETQWGLLRSQSLAERVVTELRLQDSAKFFEMFGATSIVEEIAASGTNAGAAADRRERVRTAAAILLGNAEIVPRRLSSLAEIRFTSPDPEFSTQVANAWAQAYIEISLERRFDATSYARNFLEERLEQLRGRLQESERAAVGYAANQRIINIPTGAPNSEDGSVAERPLVAEDLSTLNRELNEAVGARVLAESRLRGSGGSTPEALDNQAISELRTRRASLASDYARLTEQFEPDYPPARALASQMQEIDRAIAREESRVTNTLRASFDSAAARERMLRGRVQALESDMLDLRRRTIQYNIYQREVDTNRELYDALLQRYKEIGVAGGVGVNNISIVDRAQVPQGPSSPNLILNVLSAILIGGAVGVALALALEQLDQTVSDPRELEAAIGLPLLGTIPKSSMENPVEELEDPKTPLVESYLSTQTRLAFTTDHGVPRTLAVTSTRPGEGKTTTAYALARQLTRTGARVVLIDGDMRSPSLHGLFGVSGERGLSNYLAGDEDASAMVQNCSGGLKLLPAGPPPPNAAELLTGGRFAKLLTELRREFDHVVVDAPPVMGLADTPLISTVCEGVVFVVESRATPISMARVAISRLRESKARLVGVLLTKFEAQKAQYGYGYDYGYGYGASKHDEAATAA